MTVNAIGYAKTGDVEVLERFALAEMPEPQAGEVRVRIARSGVNPTDWKSRRGAVHMPIPAGQHQVPHHDGAGRIDKIGAGVDPALLGARVWTWLAAYRRLGGTAQEVIVIPAAQVEPLPDAVSYDVGASLGVPYMTAHRALTVGEDGPARLAPASLDGKVVLVSGGAGAVGHAAIQLAKWAGAMVITTVSGPEKAALAKAAGAHHIVNYKSEDAAGRIRAIAPDGVDIIVEVSIAANLRLNVAVIKFNGVIAIYSNDGGNDLHISVRETMTLNARLQFVLIYTISDAAKRAAADAVGSALRDGAIGTGEAAGMPLHHFALDAVKDAHAALERGGLIGRVIVDVGEPG